MIRISRGTEPASFADKQMQCDAEFAIQSASHFAPYPIKPSEFWTKNRRKWEFEADLLFVNCHHKCAYCEQNVIDAPHYIDHFRPKEKFPTLMFVWTNWLPICQKCNSVKSSQFPDCAGVPCFIDPSNDNPQDHLQFIGVTLFGISLRGEETVKKLRLHRITLEEQRSQRLAEINELLLLAGNPAYKAIARKLLLWSMQDDAPFAGMARDYLKQKTPNLYANRLQAPVINKTQARGELQQLIQLVSPEMLDDDFIPAH